ncbi:MAG: hypothetical protein NC310_07375 [Roseburia sp.]|nr:hypothetical protein [Anaeroplasma bactoclasticum]MCM1196870.1 hypothetical protein [Roseburia sp.]MCM1556100.1 hypothetical protein [Anaeroplasma bactoclasticum]
MLEYLFTFIKNNIFVIFLVLVFLASASAYSKKIKFFFLGTLGLAFVYFVLLCLYRLGIGIDSLYEWSSKYVILLCNQLDLFSMVFVQQSFILTKTLEVLGHHSLTDVILCITQLAFLIALVLLTIIIVIPRFVGEKVNKIKISRFCINKYSLFINTNNRTQTRFIFLSKLRC